MRILCIVLLSIFVLAGAFLGGSLCWSVTKGPNSEKLAKLTEAVAATRQVGTMTKDLAIVDGKTAGETTALLEKGVRAYRYLQFGGGATAVICVVLLVLAIKRSSKPILITAVIGALVGLTGFVMAPPAALDTDLHDFSYFIAILVIGAALFAWLSDLAGRRRLAAAGAR